MTLTRWILALALLKVARRAIAGGKGPFASGQARVSRETLPWINRARQESAACRAGDGLGLRTQGTEGELIGRLQNSARATLKLP